MIARGIYRLLLLCYPGEFRREYGGEMLAQFSEDWVAARRRGWGARVIFWLHVVCDWLLSAARAQGETAAQDLRSTAGSLRRRPTSTATLALLFAVVISANTCILTIGKAMLFHPLSYDTGGRLVYLAQSRAAGAVDWQPIPMGLVRDLGAQSRTLTDLAWFSDVTTEVSGARVHVFRATPQVWKNLGIQAEYGRLPDESDETAAALGPRLWARLYGGNSAAVGKTLHLSGREYRVAGVVKQQPDFPFDADVWLASPPEGAYVAAFGRLRPGASLADAQAEVKKIQRRGRNEFPVQLDWLRNANSDSRYAYILALLQAAFLAALLLTCADLGTFQFAHVERRRRDVAIRMAVGASRSRLLRFLLTESLVVAAAAIVLSQPITLAALLLWREKLDFWGLHRIAGWSAIGFDSSSVAVAIGLGLGSGVLGAILPSWRLVNRGPWAMMHPRAKTAAWAGWLRPALLGAQFGLAIVALFLALAFQREGLGRVESRGVRFFDGTWQVTLPPKGSGTESAAVLRQITQRLEGRGYAPLVVWPPPFTEEPGPFQYESGGRRLLAEWMSVNGRFFEMPGFRWRSGRVWTEGEAARCNHLRLVVNEALARSAGNLAGSIVLVNASGHRVEAEISGIVDQPSLDLYQTRAGPMIFLPYQCATIPQRNLIVPMARGAQDTIEQAVHEVDASLQPVVRDFGQRIRENEIAWRFVIDALWGAALLALALALAGVAANLTQICAERRHEMAVRCALGGVAGDLWTFLTRQVAAALLLGTAAAALVGTAILWLPTGLQPDSAIEAGTAGAAAILLLWSVWVVACRLASGRAAVRFGEPLRHV